MRKELFSHFAVKTASWTGSPSAFFLAAGAVGTWAVTGPIFHFSDSWQLVINTSTSVATFLMVFLIQNTQNRDTKAIQIKLDELIRATQGAHTVMLGLDELSEKELDEVRDKYRALGQDAKEMLRNGEEDIHTPEVNLDNHTV